ncbi:hypothetical protein AMAG_18533 [Allomyces macrogynus ATCC 38327]|uniref:Uncharacterized protein n=1 Tax=Allomyces macrogynus (strain ATCC 38327) TaxID=578462 RepID=A0A0L0SDB0_ALLM3|nr:hypothetical protein AMAG_18533 [Allomyces macrogynus ATCC 38327]|eukprot:KNE60432.1 hypothetical protein AMAG_18533 [Allomyces macrogynus ATCC 38327]
MPSPLPAGSIPLPTTPAPAPPPLPPALHVPPPLPPLLTLPLRAPPSRRMAVEQVVIETSSQMLARNAPRLGGGRAATAPTPVAQKPVVRDAKVAGPLPPPPTTTPRARRASASAAAATPGGTRRASITASAAAERTRPPQLLPLGREPEPDSEPEAELEPVRIRGRLVEIRIPIRVWRKMPIVRPAEPDTVDSDSDSMVDMDLDIGEEDQASAAARPARSRPRRSCREMGPETVDRDTDSQRAAEMDLDDEMAPPDQADAAGRPARSRSRRPPPPPPRLLRGRRVQDSCDEEDDDVIDVEGVDSLSPLLAVDLPDSGHGASRAVSPELNLDEGPVPVAAARPHKRKLELVTSEVLNMVAKRPRDGVVEVMSVV